MEEWKEFTAKTVDEAVTEALVKLGTTSNINIYNLFFLVILNL